MTNEVLKYEFSGATRQVFNSRGDLVTVHQIMASTSLELNCCRGTNADVKIMLDRGDVGGWVENEDNLSQFNNCWISESSVVLGSSKITENVYVENSLIDGNVYLSGDVFVFDSVIRDSVSLLGRIAVRKSTLSGSIDLETDYLEIWESNLTSTEARP